MNGVKGFLEGRQLPTCEMHIYDTNYVLLYVSQVYFVRIKYILRMTSIKSEHLASRMLFRPQ